MTFEELAKRVELTAGDFANLSVEAPDYPEIAKHANEIMRNRLMMSIGLDCHKCGVLRKQRDGFLSEKIDEERKRHAEVAELRQRIEKVSEDRYTRDDEIGYLTYDMESCLFTLGSRPDGETAGYGGTQETLFAQLEYVRDMLQSVFNFYSKRKKSS